MAKRSITDEEIALIKAMRECGMRNSAIQFYFNRPDRQVNSGRITNIGDGTYSDSSDIPAASNVKLDAFLALYAADANSTTLSSPQVSAGPVDKATIEAMFEQDAGGTWRFVDRTALVDDRIVEQRDAGLGTCGHERGSF